MIVDSAASRRRRSSLLDSLDVLDQLRKREQPVVTVKPVGMESDQAKRVTQMGGIPAEAVD